MNAASPRSSTTINEMASSAWRNRDVILQLTKREILGRYRGSLFGVAWSLINPIVMLAVYTFVFSVVFRARWGSHPTEGRLDFAVILFCGMIVFGIFSECVSRAPLLIVSQPNFVKKVVFPLEILPYVTLLSALFHAMMSMLVLIALMVVGRGQLHATLLLAPLVLAPFFMLCLGLCWFLSALGVYLRDVGQVVGIVLMALMFLSPLFYPSSALPGPFRVLVMLNPVAFPIEQVRAVMVFGRMPNWLGLAIYSFAGPLIMWLGFVWFQRARNGFADVL